MPSIEVVCQRGFTAIEACESLQTVGLERPPCSVSTLRSRDIGTDLPAMFVLDQQGGPIPCIPKTNFADNNKNYTYFQKVLDNIHYFKYVIIVSIGLKPQKCGGDDEFYKTERLGEQSNYRQ